LHKIRVFHYISVRYLLFGVFLLVFWVFFDVFFGEKKQQRICIFV